VPRNTNASWRAQFNWILDELEAAFAYRDYRELQIGKVHLFEGVYGDRVLHGAAAYRRWLDNVRRTKDADAALLMYKRLEPERLEAAKNASLGDQTTWQALLERKLSGAFSLVTIGQPPSRPSVGRPPYCDDDIWRAALRDALSFKTRDTAAGRKPTNKEAIDHMRRQLERTGHLSDVFALRLKSGPRQFTQWVKDLAQWQDRHPGHT
jgi:hypothetical protein